MTIKLRIIGAFTIVLAILLALGGSGLRLALWRHGSFGDPAPHSFPHSNMLFLGKSGVELIDPDPSHGVVHVVTADAILLEERFHLLFENQVRSFGSGIGCFRSPNTFNTVHPNEGEYRKGGQGSVEGNVYLMA